MDSVLRNENTNDIFKRETERLEKKLKRQQTGVEDTKRLLAEVKQLIR